MNGSVQRVGSRFTQPGDQEPGAGSFSAAGGNPAMFFDPVTGASAAPTTRTSGR